MLTVQQDMSLTNTPVHGLGDRSFVIARGGIFRASD
jgi:hypothetical protein